MTNAIRVLHVFNIMNRGGAETMIMNYYRHINREKLQFDFIVHREEKGAYDDEIEALGGKIYRLPPFNPLNIRAYNRAIKKVLQEHPEYRIIHAHNCTTDMYELREAKKQGIPVRIAHSHLAKRELDFKTPFFAYNNLRINEFCTHRFACSHNAASWHYGKRSGDSQIINNAIDVEKYVYNEEIRKKYRQELDIEGCFVVGHVGRFNPSKNHRFIIEVFERMYKKKPNSRLVLVGKEDTEYEPVRELVQQKGLDQYVIFTGMREDVHHLLQAFDVFIFPSKFEALPVTLIEAQAAGLRCIVSDTITRDIEVTELVQFKGLSEKEEEWAKVLFEVGKSVREDQSEDLRSHRYDIETNAKMLEQFYIGC